MSDSTFSVENGKAQWVRVADVVAIGPLMVAGGFALGRRHPIAGLLLTLFGVGTVFYNARNWYVTRRHTVAVAPQAPVTAQPTVPISNTSGGRRRHAT